MVFVVPLYHPLRLISEICMLDQMSGGRLELSFGRGASPIELEYFGADPAAAQDIYNEAVEVILTGLTHKTLSFHGKHFNFDNVPMALGPLQKPHPPIWYGAHAPDSAARAARQALNIINLDPTARHPGNRRELSQDLAGRPRARRRCRRSGSAASSSWPTPMHRRCGLRAAPTGRGSTASYICRGCAAARRPIRGRRNSSR